MTTLKQNLPWIGLHPAANVRNTIIAGMLIITALFGGLGIWAALAPLTGAIIAQGLIKVDTNRKTVQHLEGGIVSEILVRDGDHVQAGQTLIVLQDERISASVDLLQGQLDAELARAARLQAVRDGLDTIPFPEKLSASTDPDVQELLHGETVFFNTIHESLANQIELINRQIKQAEDQIAGLASQIKAEETAAAYLQQEIDANEQMEKKQYVQKVHILALKRGIEEYEARKGEHHAEMALARQRITELQLRIIDLKNAHVREAADKLTLAQATIYDIEERMRPAHDASLRQQVVAPITGRIINLKIFTIGGVIGPREPILDIVPDDNPLIVEASVNVEDIDDLSPGQIADIRLSAYKVRTTPLLEGKVTYISADRLTNEATGVPYYLAHIEIDPATLSEAPELHLYPGMPAEVFIRTGARTAIDYLLAPIEATLRRSMRES